MSEELKQRIKCMHDGEVDLMDHILSKCSVQGQELVWHLASSLWEKKTGSALPRQDVFAVLGSPLMRMKDESGKISLSLSRLYRIVVLEAAHLIWVLRCEQVIRNDDSPHTPTEIINRWNALMEKRAKMDAKLANVKLSKRAIPLPLVLNTWRGTDVVDIVSLCCQGTKYSRVLVGSRPDSRNGVG